MSTLQSGLTPKMKPLPQKRSVLVAALDVGTSKIACLIGRLKLRQPEDVLRHRSHAINVLGFGHTLARGMKAGGVIDLAQAETAIRQCADLAERAARMQLDSVIVSISAGRPASELISASIDVTGPSVGERDIARVLTVGSRHSVREGRIALHSLPIGYAIDGVRGVGLGQEIIKTGCAAVVYEFHGVIVISKLHTCFADFFAGIFDHASAFGNWLNRKSAHSVNWGWLEYQAVIVATDVKKLITPRPSGVRRMQRTTAVLSRSGDTRIWMLEPTQS
jgi:hypothetical protein